MASINSRIKTAYTHAHDVDPQCGVYLAVWLYFTYAMESDQHKSLLMTQMRAVDITKSKTFQGFLSYVEKLGHINGQLCNEDKSNLLNLRI